MIPILNPEQTLKSNVQNFLDSLKASGFKGDIMTNYGHRLINATDNSIYQLMPQAVLAPKTEEDIAKTTKLLSREKFRNIAITPRGGGTGTNGQSLNHTITLDLSKYMREILDFNVERQEITVEPGVILDELNEFLKPHGLFFPPTLSPSNRATIGGMVSTDACGKGSRIYGKTSNYVKSLTLYLPSGEKWEVGHYSNAEEVTSLSKKDSYVGNITKTLNGIYNKHSDNIKNRLPDINRKFSGYNLAGIYENEDFSPTNIIAGSEGTLGVISSITLKLKKIPKYRHLVALCYEDFDTTLRQAKHLLSFNPLAIETFDGKVFQLARKDNVWHSVQNYMPKGKDAEKVGGCNLVEFVGNNLKKVEQDVARLKADIGKAFFVAIATEPDAIGSLWELRKKGVGLLGNIEGDKRPVPFVEDTAVPPERLADFISEYRFLLDEEGVDYGMFGHVDTGCLHVRPSLNLREKEDESRIRRISNQVVELVKTYGGLMWGEHGKGFRAEFTPDFIGEELYEEIRQIKAAFDPHNQLNPGKIATASGTELPLYGIDKVPMRGQFDKDINEEAILKFPKSIECNGNGACFNYSPDDAMCPSYKATWDRRHSPKGRAGLMREWLRQISLAGYDIKKGSVLTNNNKGKKSTDFSHEVYDSMRECLACKACASTCPIKVDIPDMRARFFELYHTRYRRPVRDYLIKFSEEIGQFSAKFPRAIGAFQAMLPSSLLKMKHLPKPSAPSFNNMLKKSGGGASYLDSNHMSIPDNDGSSVILVQDAYTSFYDGEVVRDIAFLLNLLDIRVLVAPFKANGKSRHVKGFLGSFRKVASENDLYMRELSAFGLPMIGVDASITLTYREEYKQMLENTGDYQIHMLQEWLINQINKGMLDSFKNKGSGTYYLFSHCTEQTSLPESPKVWQKVFAYFGLNLEIIKTGCCGMAGTYGHESEHEDTSHKLYEMSWEEPINKAGKKSAVTGYSCRCQVERFSSHRPSHPAQILLKALDI